MPGPPIPLQSASSTGSSTDQPFKETILQILNNQHMLLARMAEQMTNIQGNVQSTSRNELVLDSLASNITEFAYDPETGCCFDAWFSRYADLFEKDATQLDDDAKLSKEYSFEQTVAKLRTIFGSPVSTFHRRYQCLQTAKEENDDFITYSCKMNRACADFKLQELKEDQFKCLIFVCGLRSSKDADIRMRLLSKINETQDITLEKVVEECKSLINLKRDTVLIGSQSISAAAAMHAVRTSSPHGNRRKTEKFGGNKSDTPKTPCWSCGGMHFSSQCNFKDHKCRECGWTGHKEGYCSCFASKSRSKPFNGKQQNKNHAAKIVTVSNLRRGRRYVETAINGVPVELQLDSGLDITIISRQNWINVGAPKTSPPNCQVQTASGDRLGIEAMFRATYTIGGTQQKGSDLMDEFGLWDVPFSSVCKLVGSQQPDQQILELKAKFPDVFTNRMGLCTTTQVRLTLKPDAQPVFKPKRPVSYNMEAVVEDELKRLEDLGIITPVTYAD
ncbi:uncharacterized protein K02A2.6-like [Topomyia yanbarensis]|uniref:uncharacterized protein K02A2.6-like n=1 Tax=Topomyia yanbarensis TaxID=2498891 RepID=UPI00273C57EF|nr:uncharacterized protein K02A2.6-like [Topomyia yanbarensis]